MVSQPPDQDGGVDDVGEDDRDGAVRCEGRRKLAASRRPAMQLEFVVHGRRQPRVRRARTYARRMIRRREPATRVEPADAPSTFVSSHFRIASKSRALSSMTSEHVAVDRRGCDRETGEDARSPLVVIAVPRTTRRRADLPGRSRWPSTSPPAHRRPSPDGLGPAPRARPPVRRAPTILRPSECLLRASAPTRTTRFAASSRTRTARWRGPEDVLDSSTRGPLSSLVLASPADRPIVTRSVVRGMRGPDAPRSRLGRRALRGASSATPGGGGRRSIVKEPPPSRSRARRNR